MPHQKYKLYSIPQTLADSINTALADGLTPLEEQEPLSLSQHADRFFYLSAESSGTQGQWVTRPYQRAIMDVISLDDVEILSWQKCGRVGYTKIIVAAMAYFAQHKRRNQVVWQPTDGDAQDFVKDEVDTMLRDCPEVGEILKVDPDKKSKHNTLQKKSFIGSVLDIKGGKSSKNYRRMTKDVGFYDELDGFDSDIDNQGDATSLGDKRLTQSPFPKSIRGSTPITKGVSQIEKSMSHADMRFHRFVPCLKCDYMQTLDWSKIKYDDNDSSTTRHVCEKCGHGALYADYEEMDARGQWRSVEWDTDASTWVDTGFWIYEDPTGQHDIILYNQACQEIQWPKHVGFWIWGAYSYDLSWSQMVDEFIDANRDKKVGAIESLKTFVNMRMGETWEEEGETVDGNMLFKRREHYAAPVPDGVQVLTAFIDVQDDRFEFEVAGHGCGEELWSIEYVRLYGDLSKQQIWDTLGERLKKQYRDTDGVLHDIRLVGIDSGGHFTDEVYNFSKKHGVHWVIPTKGHSQYGRQIADFPRKRNKSGVYLTMVGTDTCKDLVYRRYDILDPGPGYCHYPISDEYDEVYFAQATAEKKRKMYRRGVAYYVWDAQKKRNEALDCRVGNVVCIRILQQHGGFTFEQPEVVTIEPEVSAPVVPVTSEKTETYVDQGVTRRRSNFW